jgi:hypothetical protein
MEEERAAMKEKIEADGEGFALFLEGCASILTA